MALADAFCKGFFICSQFNINDSCLHNRMLKSDNFLYSLEKGNIFKTFSCRCVIYVVAKLTYLEKVLKVR